MFINAIHSDLLAVMKLLYIPAKFKCTNPVIESEGVEYGASTFQINDYSIKFRVAKTTPVKMGQFVTLWKRSKNGSIQPYDVLDALDFFIVSTRKEKRFGQFIFPKSILYQRGILSAQGSGGKMAIRVYPPWDITLNRQAQKTQEWQREYFLDLSSNSEIDWSRAHMLYS